MDRMRRRKKRGNIWKARKLNQWGTRALN